MKNATLRAPMARFFTVTFESKSAPICWPQPKNGGVAGDTSATVESPAIQRVTGPGVASLPVLRPPSAMPASAPGGAEASDDVPPASPAPLVDVDAAPDP